MKCLSRSCNSGLGSHEEWFRYLWGRETLTALRVCKLKLGAQECLVERSLKASEHGVFDGCALQS